MSANGIKIAFGGAGWLSSSVEEVREWLKVLEEAHVEIIDTAQVYGGSEQTIGKAGAASRFIVDTKMPGGFNDKICTRDVMIDACKASLKRLNTDSVRV
jgi:aflatoxin B1 aldehyde reductase